MTTIVFLTFAATVFLAYANGANDNFKGVATLVGSGTTRYRPALLWATVTTLAGSLLALTLASGLLKAFSGKGLVEPALLTDPAFMAAVGLAAAGTVMVATVVGLPISTTHSLVGALVGVGLVASGGHIAWSRLGAVFLVPLLVSPLLAGGLAIAAYVPLRRLRIKLNVTAETCVCLESGEIVPAAAADGALAARTLNLPAVRVDDQARCVTRYRGRVLGVSAATIADSVHYVSAGAVSLARGVNDTPKILAVLLASQALPARWGLLLVGLVIAVGGLLNARKVARTMSERITAMNTGQALTANVVTAFMVLFASRLGVPVSTTHVSCGSLFGIGVVTRQGHWNMIAAVVLSWAGTLPLAAALGALSYLLLA